MRIFNQAIFMGEGHIAPYFEGWYFRMVSGNGRSISVIPGISLCKNDSHCFVQLNRRKITAAGTDRQYFKGSGFAAQGAVGRRYEKGNNRKLR